MNNATKSLAEIIDEANKIVGKQISYKVFEPIKHAFSRQELSLEDVIRAFKNHPLISHEEVLCLFKRECLADKTVEISSQQIFRPHLITIVENLERWTGIEMCNEANRQGPLVDYDDQGVTIDDIAYYFSTGFKTGEGKVAEIRRRFISKAEN